MVRIILITFILLPLSHVTAGNSKTFFAPQPLSSMVSFLQMGTKKVPAQATAALPQENPLLSSLTAYASEELGQFDRFAPEKNAQLLFTFNNNTQKHDTSSSWCADTSSSHDSMFSPPMPKQSSATEKFNHARLLTLSQQAPNTPTWTLDITPFYIKSFNGADLRHYFFPAGKDALVIQGSTAGNAPDISGTWLKIVGTGVADQALISNNFQSNFRINPTYEYLGTNLYAHKQIGNFSLGHLWGEISLPVAQLTVKHGMSENGVGGNVNQIESIVTFQDAVGRNYFDNATLLYSVDAATALSQSTRQYQKLSKNPIKQIGLGDTTLRLGLTKKEFQLFARLVLPTSKAPTNEFMFEPQLGNGSHVGLGIGGAWDHSTQLAHIDSTLDVHAQIDGTYLLSNSQMRTFDITSYGAFSRYLVFRAFQDGAGRHPWYPGVNVLTKKTTVSPTGELTAHLNGAITRGNFRFGLSYGFYGAPQENLSINDSFSTSYGVAHMIGDGAAHNNISFHNNPRISTHGDVAAAAVPAPNKIISTADLDLKSATQPAKATSQFALSCGLQKKLAGDDFGINLASGVTINHTNASLAAWLIALQLTLKL